MAIIEPQLFQALLAWHQQQKFSSLADAFIELRQLCAEENYILETPALSGAPIGTNLSLLFFLYNPNPIA
ncbi:hypothetical protein [Nostoc sp.]